MSRPHARPRSHTARPPRHGRPRRCGKRWFKDRISAELAIAAIRHHGRDRSAKIPRRAYECPACKGWHLTSQEQRSFSARAMDRSSGDGARAPLPGRAESRKPVARQPLRTGQAQRARRLVQGLEPWVAAYAGDHQAEHGHGPTWRELEAVFGWDQWVGALAIRYLVEQGWLREVDGSPCLLPGERVGDG